MKSEDLSAIVSLLIGSALLVLAGYSPGSVPYDYTLNIVAFGLGLVLIIWALRKLLSK